MVVIVDELKAYTGDLTDNALDETILNSAQQIVEGDLHYAIEPKDYEAKLYMQGVDYAKLDAPIVSIDTITLNGVDVDEELYTIAHNFLVFKDRVVGQLDVSYTGGLDPAPDVVKLVILQIAALKKQEMGMRIGTSGTQLADGMGRSFTSYTNLDKWLAPLAPYRVI